MKRTSTKGSFVSAKQPSNQTKTCAECKVKEKSRQGLLEQLNRAERETLEAKNEKMQAILESRTVEDRLRDLQRDAKDKEVQLKTNAANELQQLASSH